MPAVKAVANKLWSQPADAAGNRTTHRVMLLVTDGFSQRLQAGPADAVTGRASTHAEGRAGTELNVISFNTAILTCEQGEQWAAGAGDAVEDAVPAIRA